MLCHPQQVVTSKYARNASRVKENAAPSLRTQFVVNFVTRLRTFHSYFQNFHDRKFIYFPSNPISFRQTRANIAFVLLLPHRKFLMTLCRAYELMNFIDFFRQFLNRLRPTRTNAKIIIIIVALVVTIVWNRKKFLSFTD